MCMSYSFNTYPGKPVILPISTKYNLTGYTFQAQFSSTSDFSSVTNQGNVVYSNGRVTMTLTAAQVDSLGSTYYRIKATKTSDSSFFYLTIGRMYYISATPSAPTSDLIGPDGYLKSEYLPVATPSTGVGTAAVDATNSVKGIILLAGDLGGTASLPTVPGLALKANLASPTFTGTVSGISKSMVGLGNVDNVSDTNKPISTATQTALDLKYVKPASGIPETDLTSALQTKLNSGGATVSDATTTTKGIITLAGDLAGTASSPTVPGLSLKANLASPTFTGTVSGISKSMVGLANVDNTADTAKPVSTAQQTALDLKANLASPTFTGTVSGISKSMVGLANVDNTSDLNKPISTAEQTALNLKANLASPTFTGTVSGITASMVGLGNVTNTSDANKPVSTAQQTAIDLKYTKPSSGIPETDLTSAVQTKLNTAGASSATAYMRVALWDGTNYLVNGTAVTSANRVSSTYYKFIGGPDPSGLSLGVINGDEWKAA